MCVLNSYRWREDLKRKQKTEEKNNIFSSPIPAHLDCESNEIYVRAHVWYMNRVVVHSRDASFDINIIDNRLRGETFDTEFIAFDAETETLPFHIYIRWTRSMRICLDKQSNRMRL